MHEGSIREINRARRVRAAALALAGLIAVTGCAGRHVGPRVLAGIGGAAVAAGGGAWAAGENLSGGAARPLTNAGFATVVAGLAAIVAAGGWMAVSVACVADPDCPEEEQCREVPAPPGGVPYRQCVPR
jgi:hypothetical protein